MLTKRDLVGIFEKELFRLKKKWPADVFRYGIRTTSGSTGAPLVTLSDWEVFPLSVDSYLAGAFQGNMGSTLICFGSRLHMMSLTLGLLGSTAGDRGCFVSLQDDEEHLAYIFKTLRPRCIGGFPTFVAAILAKAKNVYPDITELRLGGEMVTQTQLDVYKKYTPNASVRTLYASSEMGLMSSLPCGHTPLSVYHPAEGVTMGVHAPDEDGVGEILISKYAGEDLYIDRYRTGDAGRVYDAPCPCGHPTSIQILGRLGIDYMKVGGGLLVRQEVERVLGNEPDVTDYMMYAGMQTGSDGKLRGTLILVAQTSLASEAFPALSKRIAEELFLTPSKTLADLVRADLFLPLHIEKGEPKRTSGKTVYLRPLTDYVGTE